MSRPFSFSGFDLLGLERLGIVKHRLEYVSPLRKLRADVSAIMSTGSDASGAVDEAKVRAARDLVTKAMADPAFRLECIETALAAFEDDPQRRPPPPLFAAPEGSYTAHFVYWPSQFRNSPHMHSSWGVTAAFHNNVVVQIYDRSAGDADSAVEIDDPKLECRTRLEASPGEVGFLMPACIHNVGNESDRPAATLHLFGWDSPDVPHQAGTIWFGGTAEEGMSAGLLPRAMEIFADHLLDSDEEGAGPLLDRVFALSPASLKLRIVKRLASRDLAASYALSTRLEAELNGPARDQLAAVNRRMSLELGL